MFETIGKVGAGCFVVFLAIWLLPALLIAVPNGGGGVIGVLILGAIVALGVKNWERIKAMLAHGSPAARLTFSMGTALPSPVLAHVQAASGRLAAEAEALAPRFPAEPLDNPAMVEISHLYLHEPAEERRAVEEKYDTARRRFLRWQGDVETLQSGAEHSRSPATLEECRRLEGELTALRQYLADLDERAREAPALPEKALETATRAARALAAAEAALREAGAGGVTPELSAQLDAARTTMLRVDDAVREDAPRPLTAIRLADEVLAVATELREQAGRIPRIAEDVRRRPAEFEAARTRVAADLASAKALVASLAADYPPACWQEIRGAGSAAEQALQRAQQLWSGVAASPGGGDGSPAEALEAMDAPFAALAEASAQVRAIREHVDRLKAAAADARGAVERAEAAVDRGWVAVAAGGAASGKDVLDRAAGLVAEARAQLGASQPDPLAVVALAARARALAEIVGVSNAAQPAAPAPTEPDSEGARQVLLAVMTRAKANRDRALALSWTSSAGTLSSSTSVLINRAEQSYQQAVLLEAAIAEAGTGAPLIQAIVAATAAFRTADELAAAAYQAGWREISAPARRPGDVETEGLTRGLIAGAAASVIFEIFGNQ